ncbi:glycosyltransferase family 4 protein [Muricauda oceani]|uniref:Glycosyltransferase family 4 protein n=1 Tax=Flagellimonas oceani TaxID=2698672 RepID=A0A6G7J6B1_9FLAO|nr:glycosyltransferase family 4 protein [Allomuricauda oceani]MBW8242648.1 glycosyltransferase family 4 protein [Allomuricauda oceani]QII46403.1 glycosyltransferase family 4 protein [Allomuricauda oceani]
MKVAIVHEWLTVVAGSESCFKEFANIYPEADIFVLVSDEKSLEKLGIQKERVTNSFIQKLPKAKTKWKNYLALFPFAVEQFDLSGYDLIISSSHAVAKGVITNANQVHICYIYSPIRYAWDLYHQYLNESGLQTGLKGLVAKRILHYIRRWDRQTANNVDEFIPISNYVEKRVWRTYRRKSYKVIYPPVQVGEFTLCENKEDFYLTASRLVPYKKIDLIVEAFSTMPDKRLIVIGDGPEMKKIQAKSGENITLLGYQPFEVLKDHMQRARAFIFAAEEDFGIIPIEAQACGTPVIAYGKGGSLETVRGKFINESLENGLTGLYFKEQTVSSLKESIDHFEKYEDIFKPSEIRQFSLKFDRNIFVEEVSKTFKEIFEKHRL